MAKRAKANGKRTADTAVSDYRHQGARRKNNPPAKIAAEGTVPVVPKAEYAYNPHLPPVLRFDQKGGPDALPELLAKARTSPLSADEARLLAEALREHEPWLEWTGKREKKSFEVDPVALHIHERVSAQAILKVAARQDVDRFLFADPEQEYHEAVQFYRHDIDWSNRLILGDSLQVMSSLARREDLVGKVQMIYMDPPYGIKFASNFQPEVGRRDVKDKESDLTREPEMVKAYRDTWHLGIHSYLSYLRDRLIVAKELLADTGSIFVQISDENVHRVRSLLEEVFGIENFVVTIPLKKKGNQKSSTIDPINDFILWATRDRTAAAKKFRSLYKRLGSNVDATDVFRLAELPSGEELTATEFKARGLGAQFAAETVRWFSSENATSGGHRKNQSVLLDFNGREYDPGIKRGNCWKHTAVAESGHSGMRRLALAGRLYTGGEQVRLKRFAADFGMTPVTNWWDEFGGATDPVYVVQTNSNVIERCMLLTTDPGDLVLDPTCGSGTTAFVAEQWGRRWITIDSSRVALAIARQRLLTSQFDFYQLKDTQLGPNGGFRCKSVSYVSSSVIANCAALDPIFARHEPILDAALKKANAELAKVPKELRAKLAAKLAVKERNEGKRAVTDADRRRWILPPDNRDKKIKWTVDADSRRWYHWEVPFDIDPDWPKGLQDAVMAHRKAWRAKMDEVNACIAASAEQEELVDQPELMRGVVRVTGPFTVEAVQPPEMSLGEEIDLGFGGEPEELEAGFTAPREIVPRNDFEAQNVIAYLDQMLRYLKADGVRFMNNRQMKWSRLEPLYEAGRAEIFHAEGRWTQVGDEDADPDGHCNVGVVFGPQYGPVTAKMVEEAIRAANRAGYDDLVIAGFSFDGAATGIISENAEGVLGRGGRKLRVHLAHVRPDVNPGMNGLLKESATPGGGQLFTVFGLPRVRVDETSGADGETEYVVTMEGVDVFSPVDNSITSTGAEKVAAWFLDSDYDGRTFCITQAFFPDRSAWDKLSRALNGKDGVIDADRFEALSGTTSLAFPAGKHKCVAVKVIDPRGNEVMAVERLT